ncbi:MAG: hypothetical protein H0T11_06910 [Chthoniobacterales bacterium]|nr:hypothetical protein [Chthoniobacterales bacterium]
MITRKVHFSAGFPRGLVLALSAALLCSTATASIVNVAAPTNNWTVLRYGGNPSTDPSVDHQTGVPEGDIVGNSQQASFFTMFGDANTPSKTDGDLAFRVRPAADSGPARFRHAFFVGIISDRSSGKIESESRRAGLSVAGFRGGVFSLPAAA